MRRTLIAGLAGSLVLTAVVLGPSAHAGERDGEVATAFAETTRSTVWTQVQKIPLRFTTHHPQGFALVGDKIFMSSVEIVEPTVQYPEPVDGLDRSAGKGVGHLFVMDRQGNLVRDITLGEGDAYHPGGIDFDGTSVWVPVGEYRPNSASIIYRVDPQTYEVNEAFRVADHVGGVVRDAALGAVHGVSWGSRTLYTWTPWGRELRESPNPNHFIDYQDCQYVAGHEQICSGIAGLPAPGGGSYELGGLALLDLHDNRILHEVPFPQFSTAGHVVTRNPVALEVAGDTLRLLAAPDDGDEGVGTELLVYETPIS